MPDFRTAANFGSSRTVCCGNKILSRQVYVIFRPAACSHYRRYRRLSFLIGRNSHIETWGQQCPGAHQRVERG